MDGKDEGSDQSMKALFQEWVLTRAADYWPLHNSVEEKWSALHTSMAEAGKQVLGKMR